MEDFGHRTDRDPGHAVVGAGYKWLLAPRGIAWIALRPDYGDTLLASFANWRATAAREASVYGASLELAADARRFDASPVWPCVLAAAQSVSWLCTLDLDSVHDHCVGLASTVREALGLPPEDSPIVAVRDGRSREELRARGIVATARDGRARVGFHVYNTVGDAERCIEAFAMNQVRVHPTAGGTHVPGIP